MEKRRVAVHPAHSRACACDGRVCGARRGVVGRVARESVALRAGRPVHEVVLDPRAVNRREAEVVAEGGIAHRSQQLAEARVAGAEAAQDVHIRFVVDDEDQVLVGQVFTILHHRSQWSEEFTPLNVGARSLPRGVAGVL